MNRLLILSIIWLLCGCSTKQNICKNDAYITSLIAHSELDKGRSGDNILIYLTFQDNRTNQYTILRETDGSANFCLDKSFVEYEDKFRPRSKIVSYVGELNKKLDALGIREYSGEPDGLGTLLKLYMENGEVIYKTKPLLHITYPATLQEIKSSKKLCENWYSLAE